MMNESWVSDQVYQGMQTGAVREPTTFKYSLESQRLFACISSRLAAVIRVMDEQSKEP